MKHLLLTTIAAVLVVGCGESQQSAPAHELVRGVITACAAKDYDMFKKYTCLGMTKEEFKQFMAQSGSPKVTRIWDTAKDELKQDFLRRMRMGFKELLLEAEENNFDWNESKIVSCELSDDVKARIVSGNESLALHLDDCFATPQGLLMFDVPFAN